MRNSLFFIVLCALALVSCSEYRESNDPSLHLAFSADTISFDTVFTEQGSATAQLMIYNRYGSAITINRVWLENGEVFLVNIDGEQDLSRLTHMTINGGDSAFVFIRVRIAALNSSSPVLVEDILHFHLTNGNTQNVRLEAYGQDVERIGHKGCGRTEKGEFVFTADKPYIIYDTLVVGGALTMNPGARIYMHQGACIYALGDVNANGTLDQPILIRGDRLDDLFDSVPYLYAGGSWNGFYLQAEKEQTYHLSYVDILSGNVGLMSNSTCTDVLPQLSMDGCRIHNHTRYGLVLLNTNATVTNSEISNCASYCVYCDGGKHDFIHTTIASYFGYTNIRIQSAEKEETAAVYIDNLSKTVPLTATSFINSIITGYRTNQIVVATPLDQFYPGTFVGNYLKTDTLALPHAADNIYWQKTDTAKVFVNDFYKYKEYVYYDFRLDSLSPARNIGDSIAALPYPMDRAGVSRALIRPDAGCYQYHP
ncbi:MAG: hypothetical protein II825_08115 [Paludibacteraceae bacterium]|nr:hypothetical protein [Paludibacteraceae bacterium]